MVLVGFFCVLGALGLLVVGLVQSDPQFVWASMGASGVGGVAVAIASIQRNRAQRRLTAGPPRPPAVRAAPAATKPPENEPVATKAGAKAPIDKEPVLEMPVAVAPVAEEPERIHRHAAKERVEPGATTEAVSTERARAFVAEDSDPEEQLGDGEMIDPVDEATDPLDEPVEEDVDMADLLIVIDLTDEVLVVDLRPRYHQAGCGHLTGRTALPVPVSEAREDGFTPCGLCQPDAALATAAREARASAADRPVRARPRPGI